MTEDIYIVAITALLPLTAGMLVLQTNPYQALVVRGILGAVAALVYVLFGAADVALTEALVGTMLSITLYAVAVRSSMSLRIGVLQEELKVTQERPKADSITSEDRDLWDYPQAAESCVSALRNVMIKHALRLEWVIYPSLAALKKAIEAKEIHATLFSQSVTKEFSRGEGLTNYALTIRVQYLYDLLTAELPLTTNLQITCTTLPLSMPETPRMLEGQQ